MGKHKYFLASGGFSIADQYQQYGQTIVASNGVEGKIVTAIGDTTDFHSSLPLCSKTSELYFKKSDVGNHDVEQARVLKNRMPQKDFDWGHTHGEFKEGIVHVHEWKETSPGNWERQPPRLMNNKEMKKYGEILKMVNSNVKLRP